MSEWHGELRLAFIDEDRITFHKDPNDDIPLTLGRRYAVAIVEIDDDETLAPDLPERQTSRRVTRNPSNVAAILCKEAEFQSWASGQLVSEGRGRLPANEDTARELIRRRCNITTRADLDINPAALDLFHTKIELPYYQHLRDRQTR